MKHLLRIAIVSIFSAMLHAPAVNAAMVVSPSANTALPGNAQGVAPFRFFGSGGSRSQVLYPSTDFLSLGGPQSVTDITFRPFPGSSPSFFAGASFTVSNVIITLSTTQKSEIGLNTLSSNFADNVGSNAQVVYSGPLTLTTTATDAPGGLTKVFDYNIDLQSAFTYDPTAGNLLLDVNIPSTATVSGEGFGFITFDNANTAGDGVASVVNINDGSATTGLAATDGAIARFTTTTVPEPATAAAIAGGLSSLIIRRRR